MGVIAGQAPGSTMKTAVKSERDLVSGMRIDLFRTRRRGTFISLAVSLQDSRSRADR
jgi:hypothetical protein